MAHFSFHSLSRPIHWLLRFRNRCGYGIHSPFAFSFVTQVVYEKGEYYAYASLLSASCGKQTSLRRKDLRLLFRLMNFQRPSRCLCVGIGKDAVEMQWMAAGSRSTSFVDEASGGTQACEMIYAQADWSSRIFSLLPSLTPGGMVVLHDICSTSERKMAWQKLKLAESCTISFNLRDFGIIFYRPGMQRQSYRINYF